MLDSNAIAVKGALQRGRASLERARVGSERGAALSRSTGEERELAQRFARAFTEDDIQGVVELLADDAWLAMPPAPHEYRGPEAIAAFLKASAGWRAGRRLRLVPTWANGQPAFGCYLAHQGDPTLHPTGIIVLTLSGDRISVISRFLDDGLCRIFGLADALAQRPQVGPDQGSDTAQVEGQSS